MLGPQLLPFPRFIQRLSGTFTLSKGIHFPPVKVVRSNRAPRQVEGYCLTITKLGIEILHRDSNGLKMAQATLRQMLAQYGTSLPCLKIRDWPDFPRRGVMLDVSRGRVPKLDTLLDLAEKLAGLKINELQLYTEHTFAYCKYRSVWQSWGALTDSEMKILDRRCHELGIDLVPNQNSFGHLRYFLEDKRLKKLGEISQPYAAESGEVETGNHDFLRRPTTLAPNHPGTLPFLRGLYNELLPSFSSKLFNVGCDETWDLGRGRSKKLCMAKGKDHVYLDFLKQIHREVSRRGRTMMFWGDIILKYPKLIRELASLGAPAFGPARTSLKSKPAGKDAGASRIIALNWGYEADHPFARETAKFAQAKIPFYVCPGTSTWQTLIGKHDNALVNLRVAAETGRKYGAVGYLIADWGDGGHPQPLAVSWPMFAAGAALAWNGRSLDKKTLATVLNRDVFADDSGKVAQVAIKLGLAHKKLGVTAPNETPLGTVIAAPKPEDRELFCRNGLTWFAKIPAAKIRATLAEIEKQRDVLQAVRSAGHRPGKNRESTPACRNDARRSVLLEELDLAARMAAQSCQFMLWQQAVAAGRIKEVKQLAQTGIRDLQKLEKDYAKLWPLRNKATPKHSTPFLRWRMDDYRRGFVI